MFHKLLRTRYAIQFLLLSLLFLNYTPDAKATEKETANWTQSIREERPASLLCERKVFDAAGEKPRDVKKHQFRRQSGGLFFRSLGDYADATNYANSRMVAAGRWEDTKWAVQANDLHLSQETDRNHAMNSVVWLFGDLAQDLADEVFCWGIRNLDPATLVPTRLNQFRAALRQTGWEMSGEVLEFSDSGLPTKLLCIFQGPTGPYQTNEIECTFSPQAKTPCLPKEIRSFLLIGSRRIPQIFLHIEEYQFTENLMPKEQFLPGLFSSAAPFRFDLVTTERGVFQQQGDKLVKVPDRSTAKPVGAKMRYLYFLLVFVAGGTLVLALRRRSTLPKKSSP